MSSSIALDRRRNLAVSTKPTMVERYELQIKDNSAIGHPLWEIQEVFVRKIQATNQRDRLVITKPQWSVRIVRVVSICEVIL